MNSKKIVSMIGAAAVAASMALSSLPVCAAVTTMPDGGAFDAAYYAATYPDVVAALGTNANALYQHYKTFGAKEGRQPYAAGAAATAVTTAAKTVTLSAKEKANARSILNGFLSGKYIWEESSAAIDFGQPKDSGADYIKAENPQFAFADTNNDGVNELWITPNGVRWTMYIPSETNSGYERSIEGAVGYNAATGTYLTEDDLGWYFVVDAQNNDIWATSYMYQPGEGEMNSWADYYKWYSRTGTLDELAQTENITVLITYSTNGKIQGQKQVTDAEVAALTAPYTNMSQILNAKAYTKANVNAIK